MPQYVAPGADISSRFIAPSQQTGLVGTVRITILDSDAVADDPVLGPTTAGIIEDETGLGGYLWRGTAPTTEGKYFVVWDTGPATAQFADEDLFVTRTAVGPFTPSGHEYVTRDELKTLLGITANDFADLAIDIAVETASRACDGYKNSRYYPSTETRYYTADPTDTSVEIDPLNTLTALTVDTDGDGTYETTWVSGTDFVLEPVNAALEGRPYERVVLLDQARNRFPIYQHGVKVTGSFGWLTTPTLVKQAAILLANKLLVETRQAPLGILIAAASETVATARLGAIHPDAKFLLDQLPGSKPTVTSLQLT